MSELAKV